MSDASHAVEVRVEEAERPFTNRITARGHVWQADEPEAMGGADRGPTPVEQLLGALGACTTITLRMVAKRRGWPLEKTSVVLRRREESVPAPGGGTTRKVVVEREIRLEGEGLDDEMRARLLEIADKCPVHRLVAEATEVRTRAV